MKFKHIAVYEDTFKAFQSAKRAFAEKLPDETVTSNKVLVFLLMDLEASLNAPIELRKAMFKHNWEYWEKRGMKGGNSL